MTIVSAAILPHGDVIPALAGPTADRTLPTHHAITEAARRMHQAQPDTIVIATPHGIRIEEHVGISITERAAGSLHGHGSIITVDLAVDVQLAYSIVAESKARGIPMAPTVYGTGSGPDSRLPLDWGCVIPLWYCGQNWGRSPKVIVVTPSRSVDEPQLVDFGRAVAASARRAGRRVAFIASCDWAHAQAKDGPYGFHPDAANYDNLVKEIIRAGDLTRFIGLDRTFIENAKPDGNWQALMLAGALEGTDLRPEILSYQCPTYFGMLVAIYR
jgi:aromatic ring-opening dioxygenase LigB subunit